MTTTDVVTTGFTVYLSWPSTVLSPNGRSHWSVVGAARKKQRNEARLLTLEQLRGRGFWSRTNRPQLLLGLHAPDKRKRDQDNVLASLKAALDGISDALQIDDSQFRLSMEWGEPTRGGFITVRIIA